MINGKGKPTPEQVAKKEDIRYSITDMTKGGRYGSMRE
jgi:hypothetical protein